MKILPYLLALCEPQPPHVCSIVKMTLQEPDGGGGTRHRAAEVVERIAARVGASAGGDGGQDGRDTGAVPGTAAAAPEGGTDGTSGSTTASTSTSSSGNGAAAAPAAASSSEPAAPPTPTLNPPVGQDPLQSAIQLERSSRELERARAELRQTAQQLQQMREAARDPLRLLEQNGHNIVDVVQSWLGGGEGGEGGQGGQPGQGGQRGAARQQATVDPEIAELREEIRQLKERDQQQDHGARRAQRLDGVKRLINGSGDALGLTTALGLEGNALSVIEQLEQQNGAQMGPAETLQTLHHYERQTRENVTNQIQSLAKLSWAGEIMRKALGLSAAGKQDPAPAASAAPTPAQSTSRHEHTQPAAHDTGNGSNADALASTVTRSREERLSTQELRARSRAKVAEILEQRREGLG